MVLIAEKFFKFKTEKTQIGELQKVKQNIKKFRCFAPVTSTSLPNVLKREPSQSALKNDKNIFHQLTRLLLQVESSKLNYAKITVYLTIPRFMFNHAFLQFTDYRRCFKMQNKQFPCTIHLGDMLPPGKSHCLNRPGLLHWMRDERHVKNKC
uniref:Uncharacterized protein n=1 Tax=Romanomermis culicivorax TaxID=13658 RepID=A0A915JI04_ROMCU